jgi:hypothetical protein
LRDGGTEGLRHGRTERQRDRGIKRDKGWHKRKDRGTDGWIEQGTHEHCDLERMDWRTERQRNGEMKDGE